ncbi:hypothetical protein J6590_063474 [Homalodisca vitripennis]|nr:hypothetical protein J6590_063474 [Homalodisca vitripennis]
MVCNISACATVPTVTNVDQVPDGNIANLSKVQFSSNKNYTVDNVMGGRPVLPTVTNLDQVPDGNIANLSKVQFSSNKNYTVDNVMGGRIELSRPSTRYLHINVWWGPAWAPTNSWRKVRSQKGVSVPRGRRGHSALVHRGAMLLYGGYKDLRGSSNELWAFHFAQGRQIFKSARLYVEESRSRSRTLRDRFNPKNRTFMRKGSKSLSKNLKKKFEERRGWV